MSKQKPLSLYVWENSFYDYSAGLGVALAHDSEEARALLAAKIGYLHSDLAKPPDVYPITGAAAEPQAFFVHGGG